MDLTETRMFQREEQVNLKTDLSDLRLKKMMGMK